VLFRSIITLTKSTFMLNSPKQDFQKQKPLTHNNIISQL
jgi:hypothetical protein